MEQQQDESATSSSSGKARMTAAEAVIARQREDLELRRRHILAQLAAARNERHRAQLQTALADLNIQTSKLKLR